MPLIDISQEDAPLPMPTNPQIYDPGFRGVTVDTAVIPETALLTHIEGSPYSTTYFRQIIGEDSGLSGSGASISPVYQQYETIMDMILMVTSPLSMSQDETTKDISYTGTALVYPFLIPNKGDHFTADLGYGRNGIFEVLSSRRSSVYKQAVHEIDYKLVRDATSQAVEELNQKSTRTLYCDKNFLDHGQNPLLFEETYQLVKRLRRKYQMLVRNYMQMFFSNEYSTLLVGGQTSSTYDPKLTRFMLSMLSVDEAPEIVKIRSLSTDNDAIIETPSLWDALAERQDIIPNVYTQVGTVAATMFSNNPSFEAIHYSGVDRVVYPTAFRGSVDLNHGFQSLGVDGVLESNDKSMNYVGGQAQPLRPVDIEFVIQPGPLPGFSNSDTVYPTSKNLYHPIDPEGFYVLSGYFYRNSDSDQANQSQLEVQLYNFIYNRAIDIHVVDRLVDSIDDMKPLEQFYLVPLILMLIRQRIFITV